MYFIAAQIPPPSNAVTASLQLISFEAFVLSEKVRNFTPETTEPLMIKAIFFDIDGTLISFGTHRVPDSTVKALEQVHAQGIRIFIATGRPKRIINNLTQLESRHLIDGYVTINGSYCFLGDKVIYKESVPMDIVRHVGDFCALHDITCIVSTEHDIYVTRPDEQFRYLFYDYLHVEKMQVADYASLTEQRIFQLTPFFTTEQEQEIRPSLTHCSIARWHPAFVDITGGTKEHGIRQMLQVLGMNREDIMAFGDGGNDKGMLRFAGTGIAMGQAADDVKAAADYVTAPVDEDGVAKALKKFIPSLKGEN